MNEVEPWTFRAGDGTLIEVAEEHIEAARDLVRGGWHQISRKHRKLARLPEGKNGRRALIDAELALDYPHPNLEEWAGRMGADRAAMHYLSVHASREGNVVTVDIPTFAAYLKLGGGTYLDFSYDKRQAVVRWRDPSCPS
jgi:hypothetical protein